MPNFNDESLSFFNKKQAAGSGAIMPSKIQELCTILETALAEFTVAQVQLDCEYWLSSPIADVEAALRRIRAVRRRCGKVADELLEMLPMTPHENITMNKILTAYLAQHAIRASILLSIVRCPIRERQLRKPSRLGYSP